jgi:uncharacterized protein YbcC (UPF0753/DUF2309 family)
MTIERRNTTEAERMELRSHVQLAGEVISPYWPMRTFIHHNPLHGLEELPFGQAIKRGERLLGGRGYLSNQAYRRYFNENRIRTEDLLMVLTPLATDKRVNFAGRELSHVEVLRLAMVHGLGDPSSDRSPTESHSNDAMQGLMQWLTACLEHASSEYKESLTPWEAVDLLSNETLSTWCDGTLGTSIVSDINEQLVKWCSAFLDEGEAAWVMPEREQTFYRAWKRLARYDVSLSLLGVTDVAQKIDALDERPEEAVLQSLARLGIPKSAWESYFALHLAALPGWTGYIKWRSEEHHHPWQSRYPVDLIKYLAVRLFYERELVEIACRRWLKVQGDYESIRAFIQQAPYAHWLRRRFREGRLPPAVAAEVGGWMRQHQGTTAEEWNVRGRQLFEETAQWRLSERVARSARRLVELAAALGISTEQISLTPTADVVTMCDWLDGFPPGQHGPRWLQALERRHCGEMVSRLVQAAAPRRLENGSSEPDTSRPLAQMVFCIDVRSEVFRRHLEQLGGYETLGVAGFFGVPVKYQPFGGEHFVTQAPVLLKPKNHIREIPRSYHGAAARRHRTVGQAARIAHTLLYDLKQNVVTPYVMVEALGWLFSLPLLGKTLFPLWYRRVSQWLKKWWLPPLATTLTIEKLSRPDAEEIVATDHRAEIRRILRRTFPALGSAVTPALIESIRRRALGDEQYLQRGDLATTLGIAPAQEEAFIERLRQEAGISPRGLSNRLHRMTQHGYTLSEQAYAVEAALRLMGFTTGFARIVVICAHGSTSDNNPYESALDCGACGGNSGLPNARAFAAMANNRAVRDILQTRGITIPADTHFVAARHDTTCDEIHIVDMEDVPPTHRKDLGRLITDLEEAGRGAAGERGAALDDSVTEGQGRVARTRADRRSVDWAQVRPEWGLSRNNAIVIGRRELTRPLNLGGRAFLHSYDYRQDDSGKLLETIMTAPLVVAQWINMEHYFSTVDNEVYGSGSKVYHNVVGRVGVMSGAASDLRLGLPAQTVLNGPVPYHEPIRLLTIIEAPRARVESIIAKHPGLERLVHNEWILLVVYEPEDGRCYRYDIMSGWSPVQEPQAAADGGDGRKGQPQRDAAVVR